MTRKPLVCVRSKQALALTRTFHPQYTAKQHTSISISIDISIDT